MSYISLLVASLGSSMYSIMSSASSDSVTSFPIYIPSTSLSSLIVEVRTSKTMLNKSGQSGHPCFVPDFRGNAFIFSPLSIIQTVSSSYIAFIMLSYVPSVPTFWRVFITNGCWTLSKALSESIEMIIWFLFFNLLIYCTTLTDFQMLKNPYISGMNPAW